MKDGLDIKKICYNCESFSHCPCMDFCAGEKFRPTYNALKRALKSMRTCKHCTAYLHWSGACCADCNDIGEYEENHQCHNGLFEGIKNGISYTHEAQFIKLTDLIEKLQKRPDLTDAEMSAIRSVMPLCHDKKITKSVMKKMTPEENK